MRQSAGTGGPQNVLIVEDSQADAVGVRSALRNGLGARASLSVAVTLQQALDALGGDRFDAVLLDLGLPDSHGLETFTRLHTQAHTVPVIVLSGCEDESTAIDAVRLGAQDYLVKGQYSADVLVRAIHYAIERQRLLSQVLKALAYERQRLVQQPGEPGGPAAPLRGICAWCKKIRDESGRWNTIEEYLSIRTKETLTHGACPDCAEAILRRGRD